MYSNLHTCVSCRTDALSNTNNSLQLWVVRLLVLYLLRSWAHVTRYPVNKPDTSSVVIISLFFNKSRWNRIRILLFCLLYRYVMVKSAIFFIIFLKARNSSHAHFNFQIKVLFKTS